jgi:hypothetical protein
MSIEYILYLVICGYIYNVMISIAELLEIYKFKSVVHKLKLLDEELDSYVLTFKRFCLYVKYEVFPIVTFLIPFGKILVTESLLLGTYSSERYSKLISELKDLK